MQAVQAMMPLYGRQGLTPLAEEGGSAGISRRMSPELAVSRETCPSHWLHASVGASYTSPAKSLAICIPDDAVGYKEGACKTLCMLCDSVDWVDPLLDQRHVNRVDILVSAWDISFCNAHKACSGLAGVDPADMLICSRWR